MYETIQSLVPDASPTIFTGDLKDAYKPRMPRYLDLVYGVVGNHDAALVNSFPPSIIDTTIASQWVYNTLSDWTRWIGPSAANSPATTALTQ